MLLNYISDIPSDALPVVDGAMIIELQKRQKERDSRTGNASRGNAIGAIASRTIKRTLFSPRISTYLNYFAIIITPLFSVYCQAIATSYFIARWSRSKPTARDMINDGLPWRVLD